MNIGVWGWDYAALPAIAKWRQVYVDAAGRLEVVPGAAATFDTHCYGYDGANWQELRVESAASPNLRTRLYDGVNPVVSVGTAADIADTNRGLFTQAGVRGWDGTFWKSVNVEDGAGDALTNARASLSAVSKLYGYNGGTWDRLRVESNVAFNLRVRLYGGANAVLVGQSSAALAYTNYGIEAFSVLYGDDGTNLSRVGMLLAGADAVDNALNTLGVAGMLYGYNGVTWDRLRVESNTHFNLRVQLYDRGFRIASDEMDDAFGSGGRGYKTLAPLYGWDGSFFVRNALIQAHTDGLATTLPTIIVMSLLCGYNGASYDRLRTYGTGILKVGRAEVGLLTVRKIAAGQVGAVGARKLYWMVLNPSAGASVFELTDDTDGSTAIVLDHFDTTRDGHIMTFDPPMEFSNGIWLKTITNTTSIIFGYL